MRKKQYPWYLYLGTALVIFGAICAADSTPVITAIATIAMILGAICTVAYNVEEKRAEYRKKRAAERRARIRDIDFNAERRRAV